MFAILDGTPLLCQASFRLSGYVPARTYVPNTHDSTVSLHRFVLSSPRSVIRITLDSPLLPFDSGENVIVPLLRVHNWISQVPLERRLRIARLDLDLFKFTSGNSGSVDQKIFDRALGTSAVCRVVDVLLRRLEVSGGYSIRFIMSRIRNAV